MEPILEARVLLEAGGVRRAVAEEFGLTGVQSAVLALSIREIHKVSSNQGDFVLVAYPPGWRTDGEIEAECRYVAALHEAGAPVAAPVSTLGGAYRFTVGPDGRQAALVTFVPGDHLRNRPSVAAVNAYGRAIGQIHEVSDRRSDSGGRPGVDLADILDRSQRAIQATSPQRIAEVAYSAGCVAELRERLTGLVPVQGTYGMIHGDVNRANAQVGDDGSVTVLDFDFCGPGWREYDIASYLLGTRGTPQEDEFATAFLRGYLEARPGAEVTAERLALFEAVRAVFDHGILAFTLGLRGRDEVEGDFDRTFVRLQQRMAALREVWPL